MAAKALNLPFQDLDSELERLYREETERALSCREIFRLEGEAAFRSREEQTLRSLFSPPEREAMVLATGGGIADNPAALELLKHHTLTIHIREVEPVLWARITAGGLPPFIRNQGDFALLYKRRTAAYQQYAALQFDVDGRSPQEAAAALIQIIKEAANAS